MWLSSIRYGRSKPRKTVIWAGLLVAVALLFSGCPVGIDSKDLTSSRTQAPVLIDGSVVLKDANGAALGYVTKTSAAGVTVFTSKSFFVTLEWSGALADGVCWYTGAHGTGKMFYIAPQTADLLGLETSVSGRPFIAADVDASGFAIPDSSITSFQSYYSGNGIVTNASGSVPSGHVAYSLKGATLEDIGLPSPIAALSQLVFQ